LLGQLRVTTIVFAFKADTLRYCFIREKPIRTKAFCLDAVDVTFVLNHRLKLLFRVQENLSQKGHELTHRMTANRNRCFMQILIYAAINRYFLWSFSRKPFKLNGLLVPYNLAMAALNYYIFHQLATASYRLNYSIFCEPCRQVSSPNEMQVSSNNLETFFSRSLFSPLASLSINGKSVSDVNCAHWANAIVITVLTCVFFGQMKSKRNCSAENYVMQKLFLRLMGP
jgi:hypothetical protein